MKVQRWLVTKTLQKLLGFWIVIWRVSRAKNVDVEIIHQNLKMRIILINALIIICLWNELKYTHNMRSQKTRVKKQFLFWIFKRF